MAMLCASFYLGAMPNLTRQPSDLKADIPDAKDETVTPAEPAEAPSAERRTSSTPSNRR